MEKAVMYGKQGAEMENRAQAQKWENTEINIEEIDDIENMGNTVSKDREQNYERMDHNPATVVLQVEQNDSQVRVIDLFSIAGRMKQRGRLFAYLLVIAICISWIAAVLVQGFQGIFGEKSYAAAVINFNFDGIDEGKDPSGGLFDVTKLKSTVVVNEALNELGWEYDNLEEIRANLKIEGVIPDSVKQQIAVINTVAEDVAEYYATIEDINYFPSQYKVTLYQCRGLSGEETRELLDAVLLSYRKYFMDSYAGMEALGFATEVLDVNAYDYMQASDMIENEIDVMEGYVDAKAEEAPDFRANCTGLSFEDLANAINTVKRLDLDNFVSFVQANNLTRDPGVQIDYYNYQIKQYRMEIQELQTQRVNVEKTIESYEKDPVIVMSNQESVVQTLQKDEYYDSLLQQKLDLNKQISEMNTTLNEIYDMVNSLNDLEQYAKEEDYTYADSLLNNLVDTVQKWGTLVEQTTEEYFEAKLYADAYQISIPAQYSAMGSIGELAKKMVLFGVAAALLVVILWGMSGLKDEMMEARKKA